MDIEQLRLIEELTERIERLQKDLRERDHTIKKLRAEVATLQSVVNKARPLVAMLFSIVDEAHDTLHGVDVEFGLPHHIGMLHLDDLDEIPELTEEGG
jgi:uncharacterized coiled-coil protein SlyX